MVFNTMKIEAYNRDIERSKEISKLMDRYETINMIAIVVAFISFVLLVIIYERKDLF